MTRLTTVGLRDDTLAASALQVIQWAVATGTANAIAAAYEDPVLELVDGLCLCFRASAVNTSTTPTFSPDGLTARTITKRGGKALSAGDIPAANAEMIVRYNLANTRWELLAFDNPTVPWVAAGGTANAITATYSPAITALSDGLLLGFRATGANSSTTPSFAPNGLTARTIVKQGGSALLAGDIVAVGHETLVRYNLANTHWELLDPASGPATAVAIAANNTALNLVQDLWYNLAADDTGTNVNTAQPWFVSTGGVTLASDMTYMFNGILRLSRSAGTTSHTTGILFAGTAVLADIGYMAQATTGDTNTLVAIHGFWATAASVLVVKAASIAAAEQMTIVVKGTVRVTTTGTFIPQFIYSVAPGGVPTILKESFFHLHPIGVAAVETQGTWA